jgi:hypothetical protein
MDQGCICEVRTDKGEFEGKKIRLRQMLRMVSSQNFQSSNLEISLWIKA